MHTYISSIAISSHPTQRLTHMHTHLRPSLPVSKRRINGSKPRTPFTSHVHLAPLINHHLIVLQDLSTHTVPGRLAAGHELELRNALLGDELEAVDGDPCLAGGLAKAADLLQEGGVEFIG